MKTYIKVLAAATCVFGPSQVHALQAGGIHPADKWYDPETDKTLPERMAATLANDRKPNSQQWQHYILYLHEVAKKFKFMQDDVRHLQQVFLTENNKALMKLRDSPSRDEIKAGIVTYLAGTGKQPPPVPRTLLDLLAQEDQE